MATESNLYGYFAPNIWSRPGMRLVTNGKTGKLPTFCSSYAIANTCLPFPTIAFDDSRLGLASGDQKALINMYADKTYKMPTQTQWNNFYPDDARAPFNMHGTAFGRNMYVGVVPAVSDYGFPFYPWAASWADVGFSEKNNKGFWKHCDWGAFVKNPYLFFEEASSTRLTGIPVPAHGNAYFAGFGNKNPDSDGSFYGLIPLQNFFLAIEKDFDAIINSAGSKSDLKTKMTNYLLRLEAWQEAAKRVEKIFFSGIISAEGYGGTTQTVGPTDPNHYGWDCGSAPSKKLTTLPYSTLSSDIDEWNEFHAVTTSMKTTISEAGSYKAYGAVDLARTSKVQLGSPDIGYFLMQTTMTHWIFGLPDFTWMKMSCAVEGQTATPRNPKWFIESQKFRPDMMHLGDGKYVDLGKVAWPRMIQDMEEFFHPVVGANPIPWEEVQFGFPYYLRAKQMSELMRHMGLTFTKTNGEFNSNWDLGGQLIALMWTHEQVEKMHTDGFIPSTIDDVEVSDDTYQRILHSNWAGYWPQAGTDKASEMKFNVTSTIAGGLSTYDKIIKTRHEMSKWCKRSTKMVQKLTLQYNYVQYVRAHAKAFIDDPDEYVEWLQEREDKNEEFHEAFADIKAVEDEAWAPVLEKLGAIQEYADTYGKEALEDLLNSCADWRVLHMGMTPEAAVESCFEDWAQSYVDVGGENVAPNRLRNQCAILALMDDLSELSWWKDTTIRSKTGMRNVIMLDHNDTKLNQKNYVINALMNNPRFAGFYTLTPEKIAALNPFLKFYMVYDRIREKKGKEKFKDLENPLVVEIPFAKSIGQDLKLNGISNVNDIFKNNSERGMGAGIKSFEWNFFGKNTFAADKDIKAKLTLFFPTLGEFLKDRTFSIDPEEAEVSGIKGQKEVSFRYSDMAAYAGAVAHQTELSYTLKVSCGWVYDTKASQWLKERFGFTEKELLAVEHSFVNLILNKVDHTIDIRDDGTVGVTINYIANAAGILRSKAANIMVGPNLMAFDDAAESIRQEIRDACEGTEGGGRAMASQFGQALGKVRRRMQISQNSELIMRLEGVRNSTQGGFSWDGIDEILVQKMKQKVAENLGMSSPKDGQINKALTNQSWLAKNMSGESNHAFDGLNLGYTKRELQSRIFLVKLTQREIGRLAAAGPNWKSGLDGDMASEYFPNIGSLAFHSIRSDDLPGGWWYAARSSHGSIARNFRKAETQFIHDEAPPSATGLAYLPEAVDFVEGERPVTSNPTLALLNAHDDYSKNLKVNQVDRAAAGATEVDPLHAQGVQQRDRQLDPNGLGERYVYYIFLQDLIDVAFSIVEENAVYMDYRDGTNKHFKEVQRTKVVLGNIEISVPSTFKDRYNDVKDGYLVKNLGDIPISVSYLRHWLILNVVQKNRKTYYILDFIKDIVRDLIVGPINDKSCWGAFHKKARANEGPIEAHGTVVNAVAKQVSKYDTTLAFGRIAASIAGSVGNVEHMETFDWLRDKYRKEGPSWLNKVYPKKDPVLNSLIRVPIGSDFPEQRYRPILSQDSSRTPSSTVEAYEYVIFYASQISMSRSGDIDEDSGDGVYHYSIGNNKGITKKIKFTKAEAKGVREARLEQAGASLSSKAQLMDKYDVELEVYGTPACTPGTLLYIDPMGLSPLLGNPSDTPEKIKREIADKGGKKAGSDIFDKASLAGIMGIGGYYIIIESTSYIEAGKYVTKIKAMFDHFGGKAGHLNPVDPAVAKDTDIVVNCDSEINPVGAE